MGKWRKLGAQTPTVEKGGVERTLPSDPSFPFNDDEQWAADSRHLIGIMSLRGLPTCSITWLNTVPTASYRRLIGDGRRLSSGADSERYASARAEHTHRQAHSYGTVDSALRLSSCQKKSAAPLQFQIREIFKVELQLGCKLGPR